jgi:hypothetical protein
LRTFNESFNVFFNRNNSERQPVLNLQIAKAYLAGTDNGIATRTWQQAIENTRNYGRGVFAWRGEACGKAQMSTKRSLCQRKTEGGPENGLANLWSRKKITKKPCAGHGQEAKWEIPDKRQ